MSDMSDADTLRKIAQLASALNDEHDARTDAFSELVRRIEKLQNQVNGIAIDMDRLASNSHSALERIAELNRRLRASEEHMLERFGALREEMQQGFVTLANLIQEQRS